MNTKRTLAALGVSAGLVAAGVILAGPASAHVAPPVGKSACTNSSVWSASGSATVSQAGSDKVRDTITATAGTVVQAPVATAQESDGQSYTYTVSGIPVSTTSVTVTSTLTWGSVDKPQIYVKTTTIKEPDGNCVPAKQACATSTYSGVSTPDALNGWANDPSTDTNPAYITDSGAVDGKGELQLTIPANDNSKTKVTWQHATTGTVPLAGIQGLGYKDNTPAGTDFRPAYQLVVNPHTTITFATLNWEPSNGNPPDGATSGWVTNANIENGLWWTSKIATGPGSQSSPASLSVIEALWPDATVSGYGVSIGHLGGNNTAAEVNKVDDISFLCGVTTFEPKVSPTTTPPTTTTTAPPTVVTTPLTTAKLVSAPGLANTGANSSTPLVLAISALVLGLAVLGSAFGYKRVHGRKLH